MESSTTPESWKLVPATTVPGTDELMMTELSTWTVTLANVSFPVYRAPLFVDSVSDWSLYITTHTS